MATTTSSNERSQVAALIALRDALVGWKDHNWPDCDSSSASLIDFCDSVSGISCNRRKDNVVGIDWKSQGLSGSLPTEIGELSHLERFQLGNNDLRGTLPSTFERLFMLEHLELNRNELSGSFPEDIFANMRSLKRLLLQSNHFTGTLPTSLCNLESLHSLDLFDNPISGSLPDCLADLTLLETLQIHDMLLTGSLPPMLCNESDCDSIACPVGTYSEQRGRISCFPCPLAEYLASTSCPETLSPTIWLATEAPSVVSASPTASTMPSSFLARNFTEEPSLSWSPSNVSGEEIATPIPSSMSDEFNETTRMPVVNNIPSPAITMEPSVPPVPKKVWIVPTQPALLPNGATSFVQDANDTNSESLASPNWTLLSAACLMSALAMLTVVLARRSNKAKRQEQEDGRSSTSTTWWRTNSRRASRSARRGVLPDSHAVNYYSQHSRAYLLQAPTKRSLSGPSSSLSGRWNRISPDLLDALDGIEPSLHGTGGTFMVQHVMGSTAEHPRTNDYSSVESDTGWNDTLSSVGDDDMGPRDEEWHDPWAIHYGCSSLSSSSDEQTKE